MPRSVAASTMQAVLGPRHRRSTMSVSLAMVAPMSYGVSLMAAMTKSRADSSAARPTASSRVRMTTL